MKKLFLVDAYALLFKYYYAFLGRPMRNRNGMNTSVVFGFVKFLRDIQKRERPDLLGVAFIPRGAVSAARSSPNTRPTAPKLRRTYSSRCPTSSGCSKPCASRFSKSRAMRPTT